MRIGCHLPMYGPVATRRSVLAFARRVEALGYDSLWASDHVVIPHRIASRYPYSPTGQFPLGPEVPFLEPFTTLALVAGVTERVQLGTSILVLPHRNPVLAAKMAATLDHLSEGRLVLGVGVGWMREEIELLGGDYDRRGAWSDEALAVMRACWRDARAAHHGQFFSFDDIGVFPKPARGDIPILIGGHTPRALRRVAALGDGWHAAFITPHALRADIVRLREECARQKRPFERITISVRAGLSLRSAPLGADRRPLQGSPEQVIADLAAYRDLGVESMLLETRYRDLDEMLAIYETFARDIRPRI
ncbi:MAG TPA: LLM class F420-dependent oxidoreductase [Methylomirabilota bacterium]|nr:LLM class F420-dependent oxidoreductase [Methylomirabilota bacterium]